MCGGGARRAAAGAHARWRARAHRRAASARRRRPRAPGNDEIDERAQLRRSVPPRRPQHVERLRALDVRVEHGAQPCAREFVAHREIRHACESAAANREAHARFDVVADHRPRRLDVGVARRGPQRPALELAGGREAIEQARVVREIGGRARRAATREIVGRADDDLRERAEPPRGQPRIARLAAAHDRVEAFVDHIDEPVGEIEVELDVRVRRHEIGEHGQHGRAERGQAHAQPAARRVRAARQLLLGLLDFREHAPASLEKARAFGRQRDAARAAMEQAHVQARFEPRDPLADGRRGHAERTRRRDEAAGLGHLHEDDEPAQTFHSTAPVWFPIRF
ncbi:Uncharacterised protein [Burkholderia pseudomallei]|nr:Uncharacterised protein [Burkholderia pseudomallei]